MASVRERTAAEVGAAARAEGQQVSGEKNFAMFLVGESANAPSFHLHELLEQYTTLATFVKQPSYMLGCFSKYHGALDRNLERSGSSLRSVGRRSKLPFNGRSANEQ
jgi:hypothetical protein